MIKFEILFLDYIKEILIKSLNVISLSNNINIYFNKMHDTLIDDYKSYTCEIILNNQSKIYFNFNEKEAIFLAESFYCLNEYDITENDKKEAIKELLMDFIGKYNRTLLTNEYKIDNYNINFIKNITTKDLIFKELEVLNLNEFKFKFFYEKKLEKSFVYKEYTNELSNINSIKTMVDLIPMKVELLIGKSKLMPYNKLKQLIDNKKLIELDININDLVTLIINDIEIAKGKIIVINGNYGFKILHIL